MSYAPYQYYCQVHVNESKHTKVTKAIITEKVLTKESIT